MPWLPGNLQSQRLISTSSSLAATLGAGLLCRGRPAISPSQYHKIIKMHGRLAPQTVGASSTSTVPLSISLLHRVTSVQRGFAKRVQPLSSPWQSWSPQKLLQTQMHQHRLAERKKEPSYPTCTLLLHTVLFQPSPD